MSNKSVVLACVIIILTLFNSNHIHANEYLPTVEVYPLTRPQQVTLTQPQPVTQPYTEEIGARVYATAQALLLDKNGMLFVCRKYDIMTYYLLNANQCNSMSSIHVNDIHETDGMYAGWIVEKGRLMSYVSNKWFSYISKYSDLGEIIITIDQKFIDIFERLHTAQQNKQNLENAFSEYRDDGINYSKYIREVDSDIKLLSSHGMELAKVTIRLINTIKPIVIDAEMRLATISGRKETMEGFRSFEREINKINRIDSIQKIISDIDSAIDDLERTLAR